MPLDFHEEPSKPMAAARLWQHGRRLLERLRAGKAGLSAKLLLLTGLFVMLAEVLIFLPSIASFRVAWLTDRLTRAELASLATEGVPGGTVPPMLRADLLRSAQVKAIAIKRADQRQQVLPADGPLTIDDHFDLTSMQNGAVGSLGHQLALIGDALAVFTSPRGRIIRVTGMITGKEGDVVEVVLPEAPLRKAMVAHALNILALSVIISMITAALVYFALNRLLVQPMMRITHAMLSFSKHPEDASRIITPSARTDEIGTAERELAHMQTELSQLLLQRNRLAQLGLAVSKINHDLRNMLANAQLLSDRLTAIPGPRVQQFAPKLIASLDRAINLCNDTLKFGRAAEAAPRRDLFVLKVLIEEVGDGLGLPRQDTVAWRVDVSDTLRVDADREHMYRVLSNLARNSAQAIEAMDAASLPGEIAVKAWREGRKVVVELRDTGPGVPDKAKAHLFQAFQGSARKGGTGLGLTIAAELVAAHGGTLSLLASERGAAFRLEIPDRSPR